MNTISDRIKNDTKSHEITNTTVNKIPNTIRIELYRKYPIQNLIRPNTTIENAYVT